MKKLITLCMFFFLLCTSYSHAQETPPAGNDASTEGDTLLQDIVFVRPEQKTQAQPLRAQLFAADDSPVVMYINFDGDLIKNTIWNTNASTIQFEAAGLSFSDKQSIIARIQDAYAPYNVVVTTTPSVFSAAPMNKRVQCDVGKYNAGISTPAGGVAYLSSMQWANDTPCFVFADLLNNAVKKIGDSTTHELAHASAGLMHDLVVATTDGTCSVVNPYRSAVGTGALSWGSIMGNSYAGTVSTFVSDATTGCNLVENELEQLTTYLGLKDDDFGNDFATAALVHTETPYSKNFILNASTDVDMFEIAGDAPRNLTVFSRGTTDLKVIIYGADHTQLAELNPTGTLSVIRTSLSPWIQEAGSLFVAIERSNDDSGSSIPTTSGTGGGILRITP